jgi:hypothetical protein
MGPAGKGTRRADTDEKSSGPWEYKTRTSTTAAQKSSRAFSAAVVKHNVYP